MASVTESTQGSKLSFGVQTDINVPQTVLEDFRPEGEPSPETGVGEGVDINTTGANPHYNEKQIVNHQPSDSAIQFQQLIRPASDAGGTPSYKAVLESGGYTVNVIPANTTILASPTPTAGVFTVDDSTGMEAGIGLSIELDTGNFITALIGSMDVDEVTLTMELPSVPSSGNAVNRAYTITPGVSTGVPNDKVLTLLHQTNVGGTQYQDSSLTSIGDIAFTPNEKLMWDFTMGESDKANKTVSATHSNDFADGTGALTTFQPWCQFASENTDYTSALTATYHKLLDSTFTSGITSAQVTGFGDANCKNNFQGWMQVSEPATNVMNMLYDVDKIDDYDGTNGYKYISIIQEGTSIDKPNVGIFMPKCHQSAPPTHEAYGNNENRLQATYKTNPSEMSGTTDADQGNQPWYIVVGDR